MTNAEVLGAFAEALIAGLGKAAQDYHQPRTMLLAIHALQAEFEKLGREGDLAPATVHLLASLGELARAELGLLAQKDREADEQLQADIRRSRDQTKEH